MVVSQGRDNYARMHAGFGWQVPERFNIAQVCCTRWARDEGTASRVAIRAHGAKDGDAALSYGALQERADRLSQVLTRLGVGRGDRVAIVMPQRFETAIAYMAVFQMGAVAMPLSMLFGPDALEYRLQDSDAAVAICDESSIGEHRGGARQLPGAAHRDRRRRRRAAGRPGLGGANWDGRPAASSPWQPRPTTAPC